LAAVFGAWAWVWAQPVPTLVLRFEEGFAASGPRGPIVATVTGTPALVPGRFGQALRAGPAFGQLEFPTASVICNGAVCT
jgi:hypothetical protein